MQDQGRSCNEIEPRRPSCAQLAWQAKEEFFLFRVQAHAAKPSKAIKCEITLTGPCSSYKIQSVTTERTRTERYLSEGSFFIALSQASPWNDAHLPPQRRKCRRTPPATWKPRKNATECFIPQPAATRSVGALETRRQTFFTNAPSDMRAGLLSAWPSYRRFDDSRRYLLRP